MNFFICCYLSEVSFEKLTETDKFYDPASVLSWQQVEQQGFRVIEPTMAKASDKNIVRNIRQNYKKLSLVRNKPLPCFHLINSLLHFDFFKA